MQPQYICELEFQVSTNHVLDVFQNCLIKKQFQMLERDQTQIIGIKENVAVLKNGLKKVFCMREDNFEQVCLVRLSIETNQIKCVRVVILKGITGSVPENRDLIDLFQQQIDKLTNKKQQDIYNEASEFVSLNQTQDNQEQPQNPYYLESTAYYMFHKLLCASNYGLGKQVNDYLQKFQTQTHLPIKHNVQQLNLFINQIVETLFQSFNFGKQETIQIMPYCKISIEKYFYLKLYDQIMQNYHDVYKQQNQLFHQKTRSIDNDQVKQALQIQDLDNYQTLRLNEVVSELQQIEHMICPKEKLKCILIGIGIIKGINVDKIQALSVDLIQYMKYTLVLSKVDRPFSQIQLLIDTSNQQDQVNLSMIQGILEWVNNNF